MYNTDIGVYDQEVHSVAKWTQSLFRASIHYFHFANDLG